MTHDFRILPDYKIFKYNQVDGNILNRLTELETNQKDVKILIQNFPNIKACCDTLNVKFDTLLKEFKLIKTRIEEIADTAHEALDKVESVEHVIKISVNTNPNHLRELDERVTELAKRFVVVKTVTEQNKEICTAVQNQIGNLNTHLITPIIKKVLDKEVTDIKDEFDHIKSIIEDDLDNFKTDISNRFNNLSNSSDTASFVNLSKLNTKIQTISTIANTALTKTNELKKNFLNNSNPIINITAINNQLANIDQEVKNVKKIVDQNKENYTSVKDKTSELTNELINISTNCKSAIMDIKTTFLTDIESVKNAIKNLKPIDNNHIDKLKTRINEIADVAHEAAQCCTNIDDLKKAVTNYINTNDLTIVKALYEDINKLKTDITSYTSKTVKLITDVDRNNMNIIKLEENSKIRDNKISSLNTFKFNYETIISKIISTKIKPVTEIITGQNVKINEIQTNLKDEINNMLALKSEQIILVKKQNTILTHIENLQNELMKITDGHKILNTRIQNHVELFDKIDQTSKTLESLIKTKCETLKVIVNDRNKLLGVDILKLGDQINQIKNSSKKSVIELTDVINKLQFNLDQLKTDIYKKLTLDYQDLSSVIKEASQLNIKTVVDLLNRADVIDRIDFLENEVNVNNKTRFINLENRLVDLQNTASEAHDLATLLKQMLNTAPDEIKTLKESTTDLTRLNQELTELTKKNEKNITAIKSDVNATKSTILELNNKITINTN